MVRQTSINNTKNFFFNLGTGVNTVMHYGQKSSPFLLCLVLTRKFSSLKLYTIRNELINM